MQRYPCLMLEMPAMPFEARSFDPKAYEVLEEVVAWADAMRAAETERADAARRRAKAIVKARRLGMPLDVIAKRLGVSRQRVREMEKAAMGPKKSRRKS